MVLCQQGNRGKKEEQTGLVQSWWNLLLLYVVFLQRVSRQQCYINQPKSCHWWFTLELLSVMIFCVWFILSGKTFSWLSSFSSLFAASYSWLRDGHTPSPRGWVGFPFTQAQGVTSLLFVTIPVSHPQPPPGIRKRRPPWRHRLDKRDTCPYQLPPSCFKITHPKLLCILFPASSHSPCWWAASDTLPAVQCHRAAAPWDPPEPRGRWAGSSPVAAAVLHLWEHSRTLYNIIALGL